MHDFIGQTINVGDFIAYPGAGNVKAEYGMLVGRVLKYIGDKISVERLDVNYVGFKVVIVRKKITLSNLNKCSVIHLPDRVKQVWDNAELEPVLVAKWIHGSSSIQENLFK